MFPNRGLLENNSRTVTFIERQGEVYEYFKKLEFATFRTR